MAKIDCGSPGLQRKFCADTRESNSRRRRLWIPEHRIDDAGGVERDREIGRPYENDA